MVVLSERNLFQHILELSVIVVNIADYIVHMGDDLHYKGLDDLEIYHKGSSLSTIRYPA